MRDSYSGNMGLSKSSDVGSIPTSRADKSKAYEVLFFVMVFYKKKFLWYNLIIKIYYLKMKKTLKILVAIILFGSIYLFVTMFGVLNKEKLDYVDSSVVKLAKNEVLPSYNKINVDIISGEFEQHFPSKDPGFAFLYDKFSECTQYYYLGRHIKCSAKKSSDIFIEAMSDPSQLFIYNKNDKTLIKSFDLPAEFNSFDCLILDNENISCEMRNI